MPVLISFITWRGRHKCQPQKRVLKKDDTRPADIIGGLFY